MPRDLTRGSVLRTMLLFSLPYLLSTFLQTLYGLADLFIAGQFNGADVISAVSIGSAIVVFVAVATTALLLLTDCVVDATSTPPGIGPRPFIPWAGPLRLARSFQR